MKTPEEITNKAETIWSVMDKNQRFGVKIGMFPRHLMEPLRGEGFSAADEHKIVVALMKMK